MLKYLNPAKTMISRASEDGSRVVVVEKGDPRFDEWTALNPADFVPPPSEPPPVPQELSFAQFIVGLAETGWITTAEAEAWLAGNALPAGVEAALGQFPINANGQKPRLRAKARALRPSVVERNNELLAVMAQARGATQSQMDDFFRTYAQI